MGALDAVCRCYTSLRHHYCISRSLIFRQGNVGVRNMGERAWSLDRWRGRITQRSGVMVKEECSNVEWRLSRMQFCGIKTYLLLLILTEVLDEYGVVERKR